MESFKLQVTNDWEFADLEDDHHASARTFFRINARLHLVEETQRQQGLQIALDLLLIERVARSGLHVIENVFLAQSAPADDLNFLDCALGLLLSVGGFEREGYRCDADNSSQKTEQTPAIRVRMRQFPQWFQPDCRSLGSVLLTKLNFC